jgi:hypothetical protein
MGITRKVTGHGCNTLIIAVKLKKILNDMGVWQLNEYTNGFLHQILQKFFSKAGLGLKSAIMLLSIFRSGVDFPALPRHSEHLDFKVWINNIYYSVLTVLYISQTKDRKNKV